MALKTKVDPFSIATTGIEITDTANNVTAGTVDARGDDGFVVATEVFTSRMAPSANYVVTASSVSLSSIKLGQKNTVTGATGKVMLSSVTVTTSAGSAPTISATGEEVEASGTNNCTCTIPAISVSGLHHAQNLCSDLTIAGGELTQSTLKIDGTTSTAEVDGTIKASDLAGAKMSFSGTIVGVNAATGAISTPTLTLAASSAWKITQPVSETNPNGDFPTYTFTVEKNLAADTSD